MTDCGVPVQALRGNVHDATKRCPTTPPICHPCRRSGIVWPGGDRMNKLYPSAEEALAGLARDGMLVAVGGFGLCGIPEALIVALRATGVRNITVADGDEIGRA